MKKLPKILAIVVVVIAVLLIARNVIIKFAAKAGTKAIVGVGLDIGKFDLGLFKSHIEIGDLKVYNPKGFEDKVMVDLPDAYVDYNLGAMLGGKVHIESFRLHLREFMVVKNKDGLVNIEELKVIKDESGEKKEKKTEEKPKKGKKADFQVDNLSLKVDRVIFKDYTKGDEPEIKEVNINLDENYENIKSLESVVLIIVVKTMTKAGLASIMNVDLGNIAAGVGDTLKGASQAATKALGDATGKSKEAIGAASDKVKGLIKNPFGN